ncbi:MAG: HEAT repeat domain-containing protein [Fimbriimonadaceae bacterium]|nr:HEAT repeat domain-containing protein [Fimbriimonadaceae bacterium]
MRFIEIGNSKLGKVGSEPFSDGVLRDRRTIELERTRMEIRALLSVVVIIAGLAVGCQSAPELSPTAKAMRAEDAAGFEKIGGLPQSDYLKIRTIGDAVKRSRTISDSDLDYALGLLKLKTREPGISMFTVLAVLSSVHNYTPRQSDQLIADLGPIIAGPDPKGDPGNVRRMAAVVLSRTGDERAIKIIQPLASDSRPHVKRDAEKSLSRLKTRS